MVFGEGIQGYFTLIKNLIWAFAIFSLIAGVQMYYMVDMNRNYKYNRGLRDLFSSKFMLSAFPSTTTTCIHVPMELEQIPLNCKDNEILVKSRIEIGILNHAQGAGEDGEIRVRPEVCMLGRGDTRTVKGLKDIR